MDNVLVIPGKALISTYEITFEYETARKNHKTRKVQIKTTSEDQASFWFYRWIERCNEKQLFKAYSNVQILGCVQEGKEIIDL